MEELGIKISRGRGREEVRNWKSQMETLKKKVSFIQENRSKENFHLRNFPGS